MSYSIVAYKGFDKNLQCNPTGDKPFQYEIGKTYEEPEADLCHKGFHACEAPLDTWRHVPPVNGARYCEVTLEDVSPQTSSDDSKRVAKKITVGAEIGIPGLAKAHVEWVKDRIKKSKSESTGGSGSNLAGGDGSNLAGGDGSNLAGGDRSNLAGGDGSNLAGGDWSNLAGGNWSIVISRGSASTGKNGIACARGNGAKVKGELGALLILAEECDNSYGIAAWKAVVVDGENAKPDTWYILKDGEFTEAEG